MRSVKEAEGSLMDLRQGPLWLYNRPSVRLNSEAAEKAKIELSLSSALGITTGSFPSTRDTNQLTHMLPPSLKSGTYDGLLP